MFWIRLVELTQRGIQIAHRRILHSIAPALCQMADWHSVEYVTNDQHPDETMQPCITARSPPSGTDVRPPPSVIGPPSSLPSFASVKAGRSGSDPIGPAKEGPLTAISDDERLLAVSKHLTKIFPKINRRLSTNGQGLSTPYMVEG